MQYFKKILHFAYPYSKYAYLNIFFNLIYAVLSALSFLFLAVVLAYSADDIALIAFSGKYLSPVSLDFFPDLVLHFCLPQALRLL